MAFHHLNHLPIDRNLAITAVGGGASIETTDVFEQHNLHVPQLNAATTEKFKNLLPDVNTIIRNPLDLGGSGANPEVFRKTLITLDSDPNISAVVFIKVYNFTNAFIEAIKEAYKNMKKPLICIAYKIIDETSDYAQKILFKRKLFDLRVPVFESIEQAAKSLDQLCAYNEYYQRTKH